MQHKVTAQIGANSISIETGKIAKLADGSVVVSCGETMVMASAVSATTIKEGQDYFPLMVDYREKAAAAGKFPGGYFKREGRPTEKETLTSRMTDRPLRPQRRVRRKSHAHRAVTKRSRFGLCRHGKRCHHDRRRCE